MKKKFDISIIFSGFSGEGIQFMGNHFCYILYKLKINFKTFTEIPSEINSPIKDFNNISNFIIRFSNKKIISYFKKSILLIVTNLISLKKNIKNVKKKGILILYFDKKNNILFKKNKKIITLIKKRKYKIIKIKNLNFFKINNIFNKFKISLTKFYLFKNSFLLGLIIYIFNLKNYKFSISFLNKKIKKKEYKKINFFLLKLGKKKAKKKIKFKFNLKFKSNKKKKEIINGNYGLVLGFIYYSLLKKIKIFYSSYPITPATSINIYFKKFKKILNIKILDSEDEISSLCYSIGASLSGKRIGITATSGPGMSLLQESLGLAVVLEIPLIIINVQRVGPSTGIPTKLEQSDLMQSIYGRHGEAPIPVVAINNIENSSKIAIYSLKIAIKFKTPIIILSDISISNNLTLFKFFKKKKTKIKKKIKKKKLKFCIGGLDKIQKHSKNIKKKQKKINSIKKYKKKNIYIFNGLKKGEILILSWGSTYDIIKESINFLLFKKKQIGYLHYILLYPFNYKILQKIYKNFKKIILFELNNKQLFYIIKSYCKKKIKIHFFNKINGSPFTLKEIIKNILKLI